jgi:hypothetical protein
VSVLVIDAEIVAVGIYWEIDSTVSAAMVLMFEMAESTIFCGSIAAALGALGSVNAAADTMINRLNPKAPALSTVRGARYSLIFKREFSYF